MSEQTMRRPRVAEGKPWEPQNSDGSINFGSYEFLAAESMVQLAHEQIVEWGDKPTRAAVGRLARSLLRAADRAQAAIRADGHVDRGDNSHTRARGAVRAALDVYPVPFDHSPGDGAIWLDAVTAHATMLLEVGATLLDPEPLP
jgi:hypothetical protein